MKVAERRGQEPQKGGAAHKEIPEANRQRGWEEGRSPE